MKYILLFAAAMFTFGAPMADAAPKKSKKAKTVAADEFDIFSPSEEEEKRAARKAAKEKAADEAVTSAAAADAKSKADSAEAAAERYIHRICG